MTLVVGMQLSDYVMLGADTRVVCRYPDGRVEHENDAIKVRRFGLGLIAGAGLASLVESVDDLLTGKDIASIDQFVEILEGERERILNEPIARDPDTREGIKHTQWMFSYLAARNADKPQLAVASYFLPSKREAIAVNRAWLLTPAGTTVEQLEEWVTFANDNLRPLERPEDVNANVNHHRAVIGRLMRMVSAVNDSVSETFRVGVHAVPNKVGIGNVFRCDANGTCVEEA